MTSAVSSTSTSATPAMNFAGLSSGIDTNGMVDKLMSVERVPQNQLKNASLKNQLKIASLQLVSQTLSGLKTAADGLAKASNWNVFTATSSNTSAATATATSSATAGNLTFTVDKVAQSQILASQNGVASLSTAGGAAAAGSTISIQVGTNTAVTVNAGTGSLTDVVNAINQNSSMNVTASAVKVGSTYRLQLSSKTLGAANTINVTGLDSSFYGTPQVLQNAQDAQITIGNATPISVTSATNDFKDVLPGATISVTAPSTAPVTVSIARDTGGLVKSMQAWVDAANTAVTAISTQTSYDPQTKKAGPLLGDSSIRRVASALSTAVSSAVSGSSIGSAGIAGVSLNKDGTLSFDSSKFLEKYNADPDAVRNLFAASGSFKVGGSPSTAFTLANAGNVIREGSYAVNITTAATQAAKTGADLSGAGGLITADENLSFKLGSTEATFAAHAGDSLTSIANGINDLFTSKNMSLVAAVESNRLVVRHLFFGSTPSFQVKSDNVGAGQTGLASVAASYETSTAGADVAGTIGGIAATGTGRRLSIASTDTTLGGLAVNVLATTPTTAQFTYSAGVNQRISNAMFTAVDSITGSITTEIDGIKEKNRQLDRQISDWDVRLAAREASLRKQFTDMETALNNSKDQGNWLASQLGAASASASK